MNVDTSFSAPWKRLGVAIVQSVALNIIAVVARETLPGGWGSGGHAFFSCLATLALGQGVAGLIAPAYRPSSATQSRRRWLFLALAIGLGVIGYMQADGFNRVETIVTVAIGAVLLALVVQFVRIVRREAVAQAARTPSTG